jgi:hypothetical protein
MARGSILKRRRFEVHAHARLERKRPRLEESTLPNYASDLRLPLVPESGRCVCATSRASGSRRISRGWTPRAS